MPPKSVPNIVIVLLIAYPSPISTISTLYPPNFHPTVNVGGDAGFGYCVITQAVETFVTTLTPVNLMNGSPVRVIEPLSVDKVSTPPPNDSVILNVVELLTVFI